ncbi:hypothetical protein D3C86_1472440 [compost metagenome]
MAALRAGLGLDAVGRVLEVQVVEALGALAVAALQAHVVPFAGALRADQIAQAVAQPVTVDHPGHRQRAAGRAGLLVLGLGDGGEVRSPQPLTPGQLQGSADEGRHARWHAGELTADQRHAPGLALAGVGAAQLVESGGERWIDLLGRHEGVQPGIDHRQPGVLAYQRLGAERRHAVGDGLGAALRIGRGDGRRRIQHLLLGAAHGGEQ